MGTRIFTAESFVNLLARSAVDFSLLVLVVPLTFAEGEHPSFFHAFTLETEIGEAKDFTVAAWDFDGWLGGDFHKLVLKSEGEIEDSKSEEAELWALYSRNASEFWDIQLGLRYDLEPQSKAYLAVGAEGLAPYLFETELHLFLSEEADVSLRFHQENELLVTQRTVLQPYFDLELFAQEVESIDAGSGLHRGELGIQLRYEHTRKFAPYADMHYERLFGESSRIARREGSPREDLILSIGLRLKF